MVAFTGDTMIPGSATAGLMAKATARLAAGDAGGALAAARACAFVQPDDAHTLQLCAIIERKFQRHAQAFALLGRAVRTAPGDAAIRNNHDAMVAKTLNQLAGLANRKPLLTKIQGLLNLAAIILACDLVVSVDCGLAHLACTLGIECWVLVQRHCDWRWHLEGERCDWYPRARVFRQTD